MRELLHEIEKRILELNAGISCDSNLGEHFSVGHRYVTPPLKTPINDARQWLRQIVNTEIGPLLEEYWFDAPDKAQKAKKRLLEGF